MKITKLLLAIAIVPLVGACSTTHTVREDPRSYSMARASIYENTDAESSARASGGSRSASRTSVTRSEPQPVPIRVKPGTQPTQYLNTNAPANTTASPNDRPGSASPLRHDTPDQPLYKR